MKKLEGVIFSLRDVLVREGRINGNLMGEIIKLLKFLKLAGIEPVLVSNSQWVMNNSETTPFSKKLSEWVDFDVRYFQGGIDGMPYKQKSGAMDYVCKNCGWDKEKVVYVGSTDDDMRAASNGGLMFLNANWHASNSPYGFEFSSVLDIAKFIDCCCLTIDDWFWVYESDNIRIYSIAPLAEFSKRYPAGAGYSKDAKEAVKFDRGNLPFWGRLMAAHLYFSGLASEANYVAPFPGHATTSKKRLLTNSLKIIAGSMRANYLEDLIVRHTNAPKSQTLRNRGDIPNHENQLSTIHLRKDPVRTGPKAYRYKHPPLKKGKTVLLVDDICTEGYSLEAARAFVESTEAKAICVTWLKTPGKNHYREISSLKPKIENPYSPYIPSGVKSQVILNESCIRNASADKQLDLAFRNYSNWDWPSGI